MSTTSVFVFDRFEVEGSLVRFYYDIRLGAEQTYKLCEKLTFPVNIPANDATVNGLLAALHLALGLSYYKLFVPETLEHPQYKLSETEADFWNHVMLNGMAEFLYVNQIDPVRLAKFGAESVEPPQFDPSQRAEEAILGIGGGKDSIVAGELLKQIGVPISGFILGTGENQGQAAAVAKDMGVEVLGVARELDPQLLELNNLPGAYNGHIPISLIFALTGLTLCAMTNKKYMIVANEANASIPNTEWRGLAVNHQWSKSMDLERRLQTYVREHISPDLYYFSVIRPLTSVAVAKLFAQTPVYLPDFTSCNLVFRIDPAARPNGRWCGQCPKCLSSFIILGPWLSESKIVEVFGKNMLGDVHLTQLFLELTGQSGHKPLDCVGTGQEIILSLNLMARHNKFTNTPLMEIARERGLIFEHNWDDSLKEVLELQGEHALPPELSEKILTLLRQELAE